MQRLSGQIHHNIAGLTLKLILHQHDLCRLRLAADNLDHILCVDIHTGKLLPLTHVGAQFPLINVMILIIYVSVVGDKSNRTVLQNILYR